MNILIVKPAISFRAQPKNYAIIDKNISRSGQPNPEDFVWLKQQGVTDIINFRMPSLSQEGFDEQAEVLRLGMKYHNIPTLPDKPSQFGIKTFLILMDEIINKGGKAHIHCRAGADRTGMYAFVYKSIKNIGTPLENEAEWLAHGHNFEKFPDLITWTKKTLKQLNKII